MNNSMYHEQFDDDDLLNNMDSLAQTKEKNNVFRKRATRLGTLTPAKLGLMRITETEKKQGSLGKEKAAELDMDHVFVKFTDFLWAMTFIAPFSYWLWIRGVTQLYARKILFKLGLIHPKCDYEALVATMCLEQTQAIHYYGRKGNIAGFYFADFPWVDSNCDAQIADLFAVEIDLETKRFVSAKMDSEILNAEEALILLWYNTIAAQHVKLHSMANWGLNLDDSLQENHAFLRRNGVVTVMYNFFGYTWFNSFFKIWAKCGFVGNGW